MVFQSESPLGPPFSSEYFVEAAFYDTYWSVKPPVLAYSSSS